MARKNPGHPHGPLSVLLGLRPRCRRPRLRLDADRGAAGGTPRVPRELPGRTGDRPRRHRRRPPRRSVRPGGAACNLAGGHEPPRGSISRACSGRSGAPGRGRDRRVGCDAARSRRQRSRTTAGSCSLTPGPSAFRSGPSTFSRRRRGKHGEPTGFRPRALGLKRRRSAAVPGPRDPDDRVELAPRKFSPRTGF